MAISALSLPIDIPWRRLAVSRDMMAGSIDFAAFPLKWRTSLSIFYYQPEVDEPANPDTRVLYFKIVCSITGYQAEREELPVSTDRGDQWGSANWTETIKRFLNTYYPCVGALIQVVVAPGDSSGHAYIPKPMFNSFPLIVDFEPKKREVYEIVTMTGEAMSQSNSGVTVTKNDSNTLSTEFDNTTKFSISGGLSTSGGAGGVGFSNESTSKQGSSTTQLNVNQADASRERREIQSYTTQLSQMYHQLDSYHLGTNRALFVLFPRPHTVPAELGMDGDGLEWSRKLEGIQEFFCVVEQPKANRKLCIAAHLDTMHVTSVGSVSNDGLLGYPIWAGHYSAFSTGRHLQGCMEIVDDAVQPLDPGMSATALKEEYVTFEKVLPLELSRRLSGDDDARVREANVRGGVLKDLLIASVNSPDRYPMGVHSFFETDVATTRLLAAKVAADSAAERRIDIPEDLRPSLGDATERLREFTPAALIGRSAADLAEQLNVSAHAIQALRLAQVGFRAASKDDLGGMGGAGVDAQGS
jgi:hypothetical protein